MEWEKPWGEAEQGDEMEEYGRVWQVREE